MSRSRLRPALLAALSLRSSALLSQAPARPSPERARVLLTMRFGLVAPLGQRQLGATAIRLGETLPLKAAPCGAH